MIPEFFVNELVQIIACNVNIDISQESLEKINIFWEKITVTKGIVEI